MPDGPAADCPVVTARPIGEFDPVQAGKVVVVLGSRGYSKRFATTVARCTGVDLAARQPQPDQHAGDQPILRGEGTPSYADLGVQVARVAKDGAVVDCLVAPAANAEIERLARTVVTASQLTRPAQQPAAVRLWCSTGAQVDAAADGIALGTRVLLARRLANTPSNAKSPEWLAAQAAETLGRAARLRQRDTAWLTRQGFGGVLAVGAGSSRPPNVTQLEYRGADRGPHVVLVGKGITFDSGGLSLKPPDSMPMMKTDCSGAAAVIATLAAAADRRLRLRVTGLLACAENLPSGSAMRPGDVVRHYGGRTSEVLNTDAEGRLVLADCLAYAARQLQPDYLVDIATLTGAATVGLGRQHGALFTADDQLARLLGDAGERSGDRVWRLPLAEEYQPAIVSMVADAANSTTDATVGGGAITAALFLQPFARGTRWAHLDIAGVGRTESDRPNCRKGATGFGVSLLTQFLGDLAAGATR